MIIQTAISSDALNDPRYADRVVASVKRWDHIREQADFVEACKKLEKSQCRALFLSMEEALTTLVNFGRFKDTLQTQKAKARSLSEATESVFLERCDQVLRETSRYLALANQLNDLLLKAGLAELIAMNATEIFMDFPLNPYALPGLYGIFRDMGADNETITAWAGAIDVLGQDWDWNLLKIHNATGTTTSLLEMAAKEHERFEEYVEATRSHGLLTLEGAGDTAGNTDDNLGTLGTIAMVALGLLLVLVL